RNWCQYNKSLVQRRSLSFLMLLMIKIHFKLSYRMLEGFTKYILNGIKLPIYSLTCKRAMNLHLDLSKLSTKRPHTVLIDFSGIKVLGEGEWKVKVHGKGRPRKWLNTFPILFAQISCQMKKVVADSFCFSSQLFDR
ncbi:MAG: transposase, partial [Chlamydiales bacterium]|nr:transposase [Chlamydiales bacterium]